MKENLSITIIIAVFVMILVFSFNKISDNINDTISAISLESQPSSVIILDAGHGGEDGGCVAYDNTLEKDINLIICRNISLIFDLFGIDYIEIRTTDISVGDTTLSTIRQRKASDINKRFDIVNSFENSILLSIHQNMFAVEKFSGTQVFYADDENSMLLAQYIQDAVVSSLQPDNKRKIKLTDDNIFLLYYAEKTSVMVECGFLSNMDELNRLKNNEYQFQISYFIFSGLNRYLNSIKEVN